MKLRSCTDAAINRKKLEIEIDGETFIAACDKAYKKVAPKLNVPGFRKGKAPRNVIERFYGKEFFYEDAIKALYPQALSEAIKEAKLEYIDDEIGLDVLEAGENGLVFTCEITVRPEVKLPSYKGIKVEKPIVPATDADVERELLGIRERNARTVDIEDRPAENGDTITFDFQGFIDDVPFNGGDAKDYNLKLGSGNFIPGFEDQIVGKSIGEEFDVNVTFPEDYQAASLAGKPAVFKCKLNAIKAKQYDELDDEFAKDYGDCDTLDELKTKIREQIVLRNEMHAKDAVDAQLCRFLVDEMECVVPEAMIEGRIDVEVREFNYKLQQSGLKLKDYLRYAGMKNVDDLREQFRPNAEKQVRTRLALEDVAKAEGIVISDEDIENSFKELAEQHNMTVNQVKQVIHADTIRVDMMVEKALAIIRESAEVTEKDYDPANDGDNQ